MGEPGTKEPLSLEELRASANLRTGRKHVLSILVENKSGVLTRIAELFRGKVVDVTKRAVIIEVTGTTDKIEAFENMVRPFGLIEMMRTGEIAISRGRGET